MLAILVPALALAMFLQPGSSAQAGSPEEQKSLIKRFTDAINSHDLAALDAIVAADLVRHCQATPELDIRSLEQFKAFLKANREVFPDEKVTPSQMVAEGDRVAFWGTYSGTQKGQMGPLPPSGKRMEIDIAGVFRIADGRIAEFWIIWDNVASLSQLGHLPPAPGEP